MTLITLSSGYWNKDIKRCWGVTSGIDTVLRQLEIAQTDLLPNLASSPTLLMASDYGGQHKQATHEAFSFFLADLAKCVSWNEERLAVRNKFLADKRRMSYKALNDAMRKRALLPFLNTADHIPGMLTTILVNKRVVNTLELTKEDRRQLPHSMAGWPNHVLRKLIFVSHLGSLLIAGLSTKGQNLLWFTDNDDFVANDQRVSELTPHFAGIASGYLGHSLGHFRFGTMKCDTGDLLIEDLASIPDFVSGAACDIPLNSTLHKQQVIKVPLRDHVPSKALVILHWMGKKRLPLKRLLLTVDEGDSIDTVRVRALDLYGD